MSASDPNQTPTGKPEGQVIKVYDRPEKKPGINPAYIAIGLVIALVLMFILYSVLHK